MAKLGTLTLTGKSGSEYVFDVYPSSASWRDNIECVYYVSERTVKTDGSGSHSAIYVGETDDLKDRFDDHHKQGCFDDHDFNAISIHLEPDSKTRLIIESDLIDALDPPCND